MNKIGIQIKIRMLKMGREDFTKYLGETLGISYQAASKKFRGIVKFSDSDVTLLKAEIGDFENEMVNCKGE